MGRAEFGVLGPVAVFVDGTEVAVGGLRTRGILAALLINANRAVSIDALVDAAWHSDPPERARVQVQNRLGDLRRLLRKACDGADPVERAGSGYAIRLEPGLLDADRFDRHVARADALAAEGRPEQAAAELEAALGLWRGPALDGLHAPPLAAAAQRLQERRLAARVKRAEHALALRRHAEVISELSEMAHQHPYQESIYELLMRALDGSGRQAEALQTFHRVREILVSQLGIEPGAALRSLHEAILRGETAPAPVQAQIHVPVPSQLPPGTHLFVGRREELDRLDAMLVDNDEQRRPGIVVVTGAAGVGKTALALHWAHRVAPRFPGGRLYLNLRGFDPLGSPAKPLDALRYLLRSLGVPPAAIPSDVDEAAAELRSLLAERRALVVLDNARNAEQVRHLLPGVATCVTLVTSRSRLTGLVASHGAVPVELKLMRAEDATNLLEAVIGEKARGSTAETAALAAKCAYLPLALRIAAAKLVCDKHLTISGYLSELTAGDALDALEAQEGDGFAVRAAFAVSYRDLPRPARHLFRLLHLTSGPDFGVDAAAALIGTTRDRARRLLDWLCEAHMATQERPGRFVLHDLLRQYSHAEAGAGASAAGLQRARRRLVDFYCDTVYEAQSLIVTTRSARVPAPVHPPVEPLRFADRESALHWHDSERQGLAGALETAAGHGWHEAAWQLVDSLFGYYLCRRHWPDWQAAAHIGLRAAEALGDQLGQARMQNSLGVIAKQTGRYDDACFHYTQGLKLAKAAGESRLSAALHVNLGGLAITRGDPQAGVEHLRMAMADPDYGHNPRYASVTYINYGCALIEMGRLDEAESRLLWALRLALEAGDDVNAGFSHQNLAEITLRRHDPARARVHAEEALRFADRLGDPLCRAAALDLVASSQAFDDLDEAALTWGRALEIYRSLRHRLQNPVEQWLGKLDGGMDRARVIELDLQRRCLARRMI